MKTKLIPLALAATTAALPAAETTQRPNVILILADDLGMGDLSFYNPKGAETPNIDRLLKTGVNFRNAYAGSAVSAPSRAAILTGMYPQRTGCTSLNYDEFVRIKTGIPTIGNLFQDNGYTTGIIGKWHCGSQNGYFPWQRGFTHTASFSIATADHEYFSFGIRTETGENPYKNTYLTDTLGDLSVQFVRDNKDKPFFLHLAHKAPHRPLQAPGELIQKYHKRGYDTNTSTIYAMVEILDKNIGKLIAELEAQKLLENTIVVFSSDNGPDPLTGIRFNMDMKGTKYSVHEGGIHVPFTVYWKGKLEPGESPEIIHFIDVLPTLADLCGIKPGDAYDIDGKSFAKILSKKGRREPPAYYWQWNRGVPFYSQNAAIRSGKWKLVRPSSSKNPSYFTFAESNEAPLLYNIEEDPGETTDLSAKSENKKIYTQLRVFLEQWSRQVEFDRLSKSK